MTLVKLDGIYGEPEYVNPEQVCSLRAWGGYEDEPSPGYDRTIIYSPNNMVFVKGHADAIARLLNAAANPMWMVKR